MVEVVVIKLLLISSCVDDDFLASATGEESIEAESSGAGDVSSSSSLVLATLTDAAADAASVSSSLWRWLVMVILLPFPSLLPRKKVATVLTARENMLYGVMCCCSMFFL